MLSFNKYSGVSEFANCMYLWVNISSEVNVGNRYENSFGCNGRTMQWFGGSKMKAGELRVLKNNQQYIRTTLV